MHVKWFFVLFGLVFTGLMIAIQLFIGSYLSYKGDERFDNSTMVHDFLFDNITDLKKQLDPILDEVPNATQMRIDQEIHYNQTTQDFNRIKQVLDIKLQDHETIGIINQSIAKILEVLNKSSNSNGSIVPTPIPVPVVENITPPPNPEPSPMPIPAPLNNVTQ